MALNFDILCLFSLLHFSKRTTSSWIKVFVMLATHSLLSIMKIRFGVDFMGILLASG